MEERTYIAIDLKSFYASAECVSMGLDPLTTNLVVADASRTEKTICLAVSPSLKSYGISGRARLFEVVQSVRKVNDQRRRRAPGGNFSRSSSDNAEVAADPSVELGYIVAPPRMGYYMEVSGKVVDVYLKYVSHEDLHVYSVDEVFIDATQYLRIYNTDAHSFAMTMIRDVLSTTGITATAGIGPNMFLAKIAMDIEAKHRSADADGVRIAELDERLFREKYWTHRPLTDFWRIGKGIAARLEANGMYTLGDVARCSVGPAYGIHNEDLLYKLFGVNAELLIDHAWGWEPCTMADIKAYRPGSRSLSHGQVLSEPYSFEKAGVVVREMADGLSMELVEKRLVTDQVVLTLVYDAVSLKGGYSGPTASDYYGREIPKPVHGSENLGRHTCSSERILKAVENLYERISDKKLMVRRIYLVCNHVRRESDKEEEQLYLFEDSVDSDKERKRQEAILEIRRKFGKNAILKGMNFEEGATAMERNKMVGGHRK